VDNGLAASDTAIWVHNAVAGTLVRIDPRTNKLVTTIPVGHGSGGVALGEGAVWVANPEEGTVSRIDPQTNRVVATVKIAPQRVVQAITVSPGAVWVSQYEQDALVRIDTQTNRVVATIPQQAGITGVSFGAGSVWTCNHHNDIHGLGQLNLQTNKVQAQLAVGGQPSQTCAAVVALAAQTVWTTSHGDVDPNTSSTTLTRLDAATQTIVTTISVPKTIAYHFAATEQGVWLYGETGVYRVDPTTNRLVGQLDIQDVFGIALGAGAVWVSKGDGTLLRITPAT
jgi:YVTN family beta-propeller protein